jgi:hypothetical protein
MTHWSLNSVLSNLHMFLMLLEFLLLFASNFIPLLSEKTYEISSSWALMAQACNCSYLGGWDQEDSRNQPGQKVHDTPISKITRAKWTADVVQVVECLFYKRKALSSNLFHQKKKFNFLFYQRKHACSLKSQKYLKDLTIKYSSLPLNLSYLPKENNFKIFKNPFLLVFISIFLTLFLNYLLPS